MEKGERIFMNNLKKEDLRMLLNQTGQWCESLYLPTHRNGPEKQQDQIRLKNLLRSTESQLLSLSVEEDTARKSLRPVHQLFANEQFWQQQSEGLALFINQELLTYYNLPLEVPELAIVSERFHLKPLLRVLFGVHRWGSFDAAEQTLEMHVEAQPGDEDLLDLAALQTLAQGGTVYEVRPEQMPDNAPMAAIYRY
jgi:hypothetical protein